MSTYTDTRKRYYQRNKDKIKQKRKEKYQKNKEHEKESALKRHAENKERNNKKSLEYYYKNRTELNKKRTLKRGYKPREDSINSEPNPKYLLNNF